MRKMKILVITYPCSPYRGSEFSVSWNFISHMSEEHELYVLYGTSGNGFGNVSEMKGYLQKNPMQNAHFIDVQVPQTKWTKFLAYLRKINYQYGSFIQYKNWHKYVLQKAEELIKHENIDIIHFLNPIGFKEPGKCWKIKNIPYAWGPMQGVENRPIHLYKAMSWKGKADALARLILHNGIMMFSPKIRKAFRRADILFAATPNTQKQIQNIFKRKSIYLPENGIIGMERNVPIEYSKNKPFNIIWIGAICERKALGLLLEALRSVPEENWQLHVVGDGKLAPKLKTKYSDLQSHITWHGSVPRTEVQKILSDAHLHVISSLGEATTTITMGSHVMGCADIDT